MKCSNKEKQAAYKARMRERRFKQKTWWVHEDDEDRADKYIARLARQRDKAT